MLSLEALQCNILYYLSVSEEILINEFVFCPIKNKHKNPKLFCSDFCHVGGKEKLVIKGVCQ